MVTFVPLGNEGRRLEMEHEMNVPRIILGQQRSQPASLVSFSQTRVLSAMVSFIP